MNGFIQFNELMRNIEREEIRRELIREWYKQRIKNPSINKKKQQNN